MKFTEIEEDQQLWQFMTHPSDALISAVSRMHGDVVVLGGSGKMGRELTALISNADKKSGIQRSIHIASTFSHQEDLERLQAIGLNCHRGDLSNTDFLDSLPQARYVIYMMGFKFGSSHDWRRAFHLNAVVPYLVGEKYSESEIVVFSSGNPYPHTDWRGSGSRESDQLDPKGVYGWNIVARESAFQTTCLRHDTQKACLYRLMYAQHLGYGVLVDLARLVWNKKPISLAMPAVNLISQRDANEIAIRVMGQCSNPPLILNVAGPRWPVRKLVHQIGEIMRVEPIVVEDENEEALLADDSLCRTLFGNYRDSVEEMIVAAAKWVMNGGAYWNKPTHFGAVDHRY